ncbi:hypothetical protein [Faecalibacterium prausnitzii]|uniref:Uncharacterized protein n=1 Tax=Faecalibacterium prausnitzii TaxID=853 RepID=A0A6L5TDF8_9FIRM|nr:hypothetical protein [Faecalibacterium prausnitzii]MSC44601.1 hypothetical protein [Faecalibacterium prausnitzii]MSC67813.1 hypothetical protein [Faecalibacterium prausnitzii]MSC73885.1 hypothetical protein [Faecalibacterium prausnitzii]MSC79562.1 hypothetical protein [Faecalibacterium prausnitzii]MSC89840.1 hypothetical protein [Faecalibacterium prausnitzii]
MKMVNAKGEAVYFNRAWKHGKETWVVQGIGETLVIGRDRQKRRSRTFTQLPQAEKYLCSHGVQSGPLSLDFSNGKNTPGKA